MKTDGVAPRKAGVLQGVSLLFPITLSVMAALFVAPVAPKIAEEFMGKDPLAGILIPMVITVPALCVALLSPFAGALGDRFGRRRLLIWSMLIYSVVGVLPYFLESLRWIVATRVVVGVVEALVMTLSTTLIGDFFKGEARNRWLAAQTGMASTTAIFCMLVVARVGEESWRNVFLLYLLPLVFLALLLAFTWEPDESDRLADPKRHAKWSDLPWRTMGIICAITLFGAVMFYTVQIKLPDAFKALGVVLPNGEYDVRTGTLYTVLASLFVPVGTVCYWWLSPRTSIPTRFVIEFLLMGVGFVLMSLIKDPLTFAFAAGLNQIGAGMLLPTLLTWAVAQLPFEVRGRGTGLWTATFSLGQFVCNNAAVPFLDGITGGILPTLGALGWMCLAAAVVTVPFLLMRPKGRPAHEG